MAMATNADHRKWRLNKYFRAVVWTLEWQLVSAWETRSLACKGSVELVVAAVVAVGNVVMGAVEPLIHWTARADVSVNRKKIQQACRICQNTVSMKKSTDYNC